MIRRALYLVDPDGARVRRGAAGRARLGGGRRRRAIWVADAYHGVLLRIDPRA